MNQPASGAVLLPRLGLVKCFTQCLLAFRPAVNLGHFELEQNMKTYFGTLLALGLVAQVATAGDITGTIKLEGTPPPEKPITVMDPTCLGLHNGKIPTTEFYVVGANQGLRDVVVYLKGVSAKSTGATAEPLLLDQKGCMYTPYVAAVQTGQKIVVRNSDPVLHNVHVMPTPSSGNKEANKAQIPKGPDLSFDFANPEMFLKFKCDVHMWMFSYICVFDNPYFAVTDKDGNFKIANVPPGKYTLAAVHRKANDGQAITKEIEVTDSGATVDLSLPVK